MKPVPRSVGVHSWLSSFAQLHSCTTAPADVDLSVTSAHFPVAVLMSSYEPSRLAYAGAAPASTSAKTPTTAATTAVIRRFLMQSPLGCSSYRVAGYATRLRNAGMCQIREIRCVDPPVSTT